MEPSTWLWPAAFFLVAVVVVVICRQQVRTLVGNLTGVKAFGFEVTFAQGLQEVRKGLPAKSVATALPTDPATYAGIVRRLNEGLAAASLRAGESPTDAVEIAGGVFRETIEGAARFSGIDLSRSSSRLIALARQGLDHELVFAAARLTWLELTALVGGPRRSSGPRVRAAGARGGRPDTRVQRQPLPPLTWRGERLTLRAWRCIRGAGCGRIRVRPES